MPFQFSEGGVPYHPPVAPELPGRVNIPQGDFVGNSIVNAFVHRAIASEQAQLEQQRIMQTADLQAQHLAYQDKWQQQDHQIAKQNADSLSKEREAQANYWLQTKEKRDSAAAEKALAQKNAKELMDGAVQSVHEFDNEAVPAATPILNQKRILNDPGGTLVDIGNWKQSFGGAKVGDAAAIEKQLDGIAKGMEVPTIPNANYVDSNGNETLVNKKDPLAWRVPAGIDPATQSAVWRNIQPSDIQRRKIQDLANEYADPINRRKIENQLISAGHGTVAESTDTQRIPWTLAKKTTKTYTPTLDPWANKLLLTLGKPRRTLESQVPSVAKAPLKKWQILAGFAKGQPVPGAGTGGAGGGDDMEADRARANQAIQLNPAAEDSIRAFFQSKYDEDL